MHEFYCRKLGIWIAGLIDYQLNIIDYNFFKLALAVIGLSLLLSSILITILKNSVYTRKLIKAD